MKNMTQQQLNALYSIAKQNFVDLDKGLLSHDEFIAMCWTEAVTTVLNIKLGITYPKRLVAEPDDE